MVIQPNSFASVRGVVPAKLLFRSNIGTPGCEEFSHFLQSILSRENIVLFKAAFDFVLFQLVKHLENRGL
jgi:hypothetical protein